MRKFYAILLLTLVFIGVSQTKAQTVSTYGFTQSNAGYTPITGGTSFTLLVGATFADDQRFLDPAVPAGGAVNTGVGFPIGFNFTYAGDTYDRFGINNNGWISLGKSALTPAVDINSTSAYTPLSSVIANTPPALRARIAAVGRDLQAQTGAELRFETIGSAPNRKLVVQWTNYKRFGATGTGDNFNFQIILNETANSVQVSYGDFVFGTTSTASVTAQIGLGGLTATDFNNRLTNAPHDWNSTTAGTSNTSGAQFLTTTIPVTPPSSGLLFTWTLPSGCTGTPAGGTTNSTITSGCAAQPFTLDVTGATVASGLTYQWQISTNGGTSWSDISGATGLTYTAPGISAPTASYRRRITCGTLSGFSAPVQITQDPFYNCYCTTSTASSVADEDIFNVTVGSLSQSSDCSTTGTGPTSILNRYSDYTTGSGAPSAPALRQATSIPFSVSVGSCGGNFSNGVAIYIDYNQNGVYDAAEQVFITAASTTGANTVSGSFTVPANAIVGITRMRVVAVETTTPLTAITACGGYTWGETEDYLVNITAGIPCTGTPVAGTATTSSATVCVGVPFNLAVSGSVSGVVGLSYQWQFSTDGGASWSDITGATGEAYTNPGISANTQFRRRITCSGSNAFSTPVTVSVATVAYAPLPFAESFEATWLSICDVREVPNNFWRSSPLTGNNSWRRQDDGFGVGTSNAWTNNLGLYTPEASLGASSARFHSYQATAGTKGQLNLHLNAATPSPTKRLNFDFINTDGTDSLVVYISTNGGTSFSRLDSVRTSTVWKTKTIIFTSTSANTILRFEATSDFGNTDIGLDNINIIDFPQCSGTPIAGTSVTSQNPVCLSTPFTLSVTGATDAAGITYQWEQSTNGGTTWTSIANATGATYTSTGITAATSYRRVIYCGTASTTSTVVAIALSTPTYATLPFAESFENTWIDVCGLRDVPNNSWRNTPVTGNNSLRREDDVTAAGWTAPLNWGYTPDASVGLHSARFHSSEIPTANRLTQQARFDLHLNAATPSAAKRLSFDVINTSGTDSLSILLSTDGGATYTWLDSTRTSAVWRTKTVDFTSTSATTIIRFLGTGDFGTTDIGIDNVLVTDFAPCSGIPTAGTTVSSLNPVCSEPFTLSLQGSASAAGLTYQWQTATSASGPWTDVAGATGFTFITSQVGSTWYRARVTCSISSDFAYSTPLQVVSPTLVSGTFTINNTLTTSVAPNFKSFNDAYNHIRCGINGPVIFNVVNNPAPYNEQLIMAAVPGASATNTITFRGQGSTISFTSTNTNERAVIKLRGADYVRFDSLTINAAAGTYGYGVQLIANADSNIVRNCTIITNATTNTTNYAGIVINGTESGLTSTGTVSCDANQFLNNNITGGYAGITLVASATATAANFNNVYRGNTVKEFYLHGIYVQGSVGTTIDSNTFTRPTRIAVGGFNGIYFTGVSTTARISKNRILNPFGGALTSTEAFNGIFFTGVDATVDNENIVVNNLIGQVNGQGAQTGISNTSSDNVWYFHNTIALDSAASTSTATTRGFYQTTLAGGILFFNNMVSITRGGTGTKHVIYLADNTTGFIANYNNLYINAPAGTANNVGYFTTNRSTIDDWRAASGQDVASVSRNPFYVAPASADYTPSNGAVDNKGTPADIATDILNAPRSLTTPDIGAYEFVALPCTLPPDAGNTLFNDTTVCQNSLVRLNLTVQTWGATQTFQWQTATSAAGPWTALGSLRDDPDTTIRASTSLFYRVAVTCGATTVFSNALQLQVSPALPAGTYTIDAGGLNTYVPGNNTGNFRSFNLAKAAMACGIVGNGPVVFNVVAGSGPYNEQLRLDSIPGTSAVNTITFNGNGNTLSFAGMTNTERAVLKLSGVDHIIFDSLRIDASAGTTYGYGVQLQNNADSNSFRRCTILSSTTSTSTNYAGVVINGSESGATTTANTVNVDGTKFDRNTITGGYYGVTLMGGTTATTYIQNNQFTNNIISEFYGFGFYVGGTRGTLLEANRFTRPTRANTASLVYGVYATSAASLNLRISKNRFTRFFGGLNNTTNTFYGVYHNLVDATAGSEVYVTNNLIYSVDNGSGPMYGFYNVGSDNVFYYHNTISLDNTASAPSGSTAGIYQTTQASGIFFRNNSITIRRGGAGQKHGIYMATAGSEITTSNNNYFVTGTNAHVGFFNGNQTTLAQWQATAANRDVNSFNLNPLYADTLNGNFRPQITGLDNKGVNVNVTTDIENATRSTTTPDLGAYEFAPIGCQNPPTAGTASVTPTTGICLEVPISLTVTGHSPLGDLTFQWQASADGTTGWANISGVQYFPEFDTVSSLTRFYRAAVTCSGTTVYTNVVSVNLNPLLVTGTYTINKANPTNYAGVSGANFNSFQDAVTAMLCGVTGPVVFNVASDTYTEQINIPYIRNTNATNTVTFQSASGNASDVTLTTAATTAANYTLRLNNTRWFTFRNMGFAGTNAAAGRVIELVDSAANINLIANRVIAPASTATGTNAVGIYAATFKGRNVLMRRNTIEGGSAGIHYTGTSTANLNRNLIVDSNNVSGAFQYGIYTSNVYRVNVSGNNVAVGDTLAAPAGYGIYASDADSGYTITRNAVTFSNTGATRTAYGIYVNNSDSGSGFRSSLMGNRINSGSGNNAILYGMYVNNSPGTYAVNNVIGLNTTGASSYGLYHNNTSFAQYLNNTVQSSATSATNNVAAYFNTTATSNVSVRNNVFSHTGGGRAMYVANASQSLASDYNMLYTSGSVLVQGGTPVTNYVNLPAWRNAAYWDLNSIVYQPAFISAVDLRPNLANPDVWAMHGRGVQIPGNNVDINGATRPTTLTSGVPDLGAYEFFPTALPTVLNPTPATPAANTTQTFMYGTDTVMKITWGPVAPPTATVRRYSGVAPTGLTGPDSMFFYTQVDVGANRDLSDYAVRLHYIDPWQGSVPDQYQLGLGKTIQQGSWIVGFPSRVDVPRKVIYQTGLNWVDKFTGLVNPYAIPQIPDKDSSNRGRRFWVAYPMNQLNGTQDMLLYLSATETANVQVRINGTNWVRNYIVPANTVRVSDILPKTGADAAWVNVPGQSVRGISITSDVPIVAYSHVIGNTSSGASMLLPVGVWGYEYRTLGITQDYGLSSYSYYYVIADNDSTWVEITSQPGITLQAQNAPIVPGTASLVKLNKGEFYMVAAQSQTEELSGSRIRAVVNNQGKCFPIAVYSGSSRTAIDLGCGSGGDFIMQQNFPSTAWGLRYLTAPTSGSTAANVLETNLYRVAVNDPTTVVRRNGVIIPVGSLQRNYYYEFTSSTADVIEANKPIMMAQFMGGSCVGNGDPEMIYISPVEQGIKEVAFYRNTLQFITVNYLTAIVPTGGTGLSSFQINAGGTIVTPDYTYPHSRPGYTVVVKRWTSAQQQVRVQCDSAFTAITYGQGSVESYGYNAGTLVKTLRAQGNISNTLSSSGRPSEFTCSGSPFRFTTLLPLRATSITFKLSSVPGLTPSADVTLTNPTPNDSTVIGTTKYYIYRLPTDYTFSQPGLYPVQIIWSHPDIESCDKTAQDVINVQVVPAPNAGFTYTPTTICEGNSVQFTGEAVTQNGVVVNQWQWTFHNATTATGQTTSFTYPTAGNYNVRLRSITADGCLKDSVRTVAINARPVVNLVSDSLNACPGDNVTFTVQAPATGVVYSWYSTATGGTAMATGTSYTVPVSANATYYVEGVSAAGCASTTRRAARVFLRGPLATPVVRVVTQDVGSITFGWNQVTGAGSYEVSVGGAAFVPANGGGNPALTHTVTGLRPLDTVSVRVRAIGILSCQTSVSAPLQGRTLPDQIYIPNSFSPNGDGLNDRLMVYGYTIQSMQFQVFNQWGEKIFESRDQNNGWDGMAGGKMQPSGVYIYVVKFVLKDGSTVERKGSINLVR